MNGIVLYEGPSEIDGKSIVAIVTGVGSSSKNSKTGGMLQCWIMRSDIPPHEAQKTGDDVSVCGSCIMRPAMKTLRKKLGIKKPCYVKTFQAPLSVYNAYCRGMYTHIDDIDTDDLVDIIGGVMMRLGSYGDPLAVPYEIWIDRLRRMGWVRTTGYSHQWRRLGAARYASLVMASCDRPEDIPRAHALGFHTALIGKKSTCPAQLRPERVTCSTCLLCDGTTGDVVFANH